MSIKAETNSWCVIGRGRGENGPRKQLDDPAVRNRTDRLLIKLKTEVGLVLYLTYDSVG